MATQRLSFVEVIGAGGGLSSAEVKAIADNASGVAVAGASVDPGEAVFASDTKKRFTNQTGAAVTLVGTSEADLIGTALTAEAAVTPVNQDFYDREIAVTGPVAADESVLVTAAGVVLTFPATGAAGDEIIVGNRSAGTVSLIGAFDGETDAIIESVGTLVFRWDVSGDEWRGVPFGQNTVGVAGVDPSQLGVI